MKFFLLMVVVSTTLATASVRFDREKVFCVKPQDEKQASVLKDLTETIELDFWYPDAIHDVAANMTVNFRVSEKESQTIQSTLEQHKMNYDLHTPSDMVKANPQGEGFQIRSSKSCV